MPYQLAWTLCQVGSEIARPAVQERLSETHPLVNEAITDYARAMNKISFDHAAKTRSSGVAGLAMVPLDSSSVQTAEARQVRSTAQADCYYSATSLYTAWLVYIILMTCLGERTTQVNRQLLGSDQRSKFRSEHSKMFKAERIDAAAGSHACKRESTSLQLSREILQLQLPQPPHQG